MAHAQGTEGIKNAVRAGVESIEHGIYLDDEVIGEMKERGTFLVPTLVAPLWVLRNAEKSPGSVLPQSVRKTKEVMADHRASITRAIAEGVRIAMGTDSGVGPHGQNLEEVRLMAEHSGMTAADAWVATTSSAAALLGVSDSLGTLEPGKLADVVLLRGDLDDLEKLGDRVVGVWKGGERCG
jgi:imidazolonepropionase-like amidohydrolase